MDTKEVKQILGHLLSNNNPKIKEITESLVESAVIKNKALIDRVLSDSFKKEKGDIDV